MKPKVQIISDELYSNILVKANESSRLRANHNFHELSEVYQRFLNVLTKGTYIQPHKHTTPPKPETFIALKGELGFFIFDDNGNIIEKYILSSNGPIYGIDIAPDVWHSVICLTDTCICFEGKSGPYIPNEDKIFATWSPSEADENRFAYLKKLEGIFNDR